MPGSPRLQGHRHSSSATCAGVLHSGPMGASLPQQHGVASPLAAPPLAAALQPQRRRRDGRRRSSVAAACAALTAAFSAIAAADLAMDIVGGDVHVPLGCLGANLPPRAEAVYTAIA